MPSGVDRYDEAARQGRLWTPAEWRGTKKLVAWFMADDSPITYATEVSNWGDKSGNNNHALQGTAAFEVGFDPIGWKAPGRNMRAIVPNGSNEAFALTSALTYSGANGMSTHAAVHQNGVAAVRSIHAGLTQAAQLRFSASATPVVQIVRSLQLLIQASTATVPAGYNVIGMDAATNYSAIWINGSREVQTSVDPAFTDIAYLFTNGGGVEFFGGPVAEIVIANTKLSFDEQIRLSGYLSWRCGTVGNLAASHPFKNRPPLIGD